MQTLEELITYKERKQHSLESKKEQIKELNTYFGEHKNAILWAQINPFNKKDKNAVTPFIEGLLAAIPSEILGVNTTEAILLGSKSTPSAIALLLGKVLFKFISKRVKNKSAKKKKKKLEEKSIETR
ncbi:MAG: hypothetical protein CFE21_10180 [Bacteroidetes bacterium B1(2017)]|nr:MAG: hypothetical protein CFE21_10180 [Bacteroidetes bacterium B1(2017)]